MGTITSASAVITLTIPLIYPTPVQLQGFAADDIYDSDDVDITETSMGVDGILSGGMVFSPISQTFSFQADSQSVQIFETWAAQQIQGVEAYAANGRTTLRTVGRSYVSTTGWLQKGPRMPSAGKTLKPRKWTIIWQNVQSTPN
jgi:hypothetical protein